MSDVLSRQCFGNCDKIVLNTPYGMATVVGAMSSAGVILIYFSDDAADPSRQRLILIWVLR